MPKQEKIKSIVMATRSEFRTTIVSLLNQSGFAAEKKLVASTEEIIDLLSDDLYWNFILDLHGRTLPQCRETLRLITDIINDSRIHPLVYLEEGQSLEAEALAKDFPNCAIVTKPISRRHLNDALVRPFMARHGHMKKVKNTDSIENSLIIETIVHVKDTIVSLKKIAADRTQIAEVIHIGQRFNGVYGTFKFFETYPGYSELVKVSEIIDSVAQTYIGGTQADKLAPHHFEIMVESAKVAFTLLKMMRDGEKLDDIMTKRCAAVYEKFLATPELKKRHSVSQAEVDALMAKLGA